MEKGKWEWVRGNLSGSFPSPPASPTLSTLLPVLFLYHVQSQGCENGGQGPRDVMHGDSIGQGCWECRDLVQVPVLLQGCSQTQASGRPPWARRSRGPPWGPSRACSPWSEESTRSKDYARLSPSRPRSWSETTELPASGTCAGLSPGGPS